MQLADGDWVPSELVVWAAGVRGPDVLRISTGSEVSRSNQLVVTPTLKTTLDESILAIGDYAYLLAEGQARPIRHGRRWRINRPPMFCKQVRRRLKGDPLSPSSIAITVRSFLGVQHGRQLDGLHRREEHVHRGVACTPDVSLALQDA